MATLRFIYTDAEGRTTSRSLDLWMEDEQYIIGLMPERTFRKDRVERYLDGTDSLLETPYVWPRTRSDGFKVFSKQADLLKVKSERHLSTRANPISGLIAKLTAWFR